jgi:hypothetical protein
MYSNKSKHIFLGWIRTWGRDGHWPEGSKMGVTARLKCWHMLGYNGALLHVVSPLKRAAPCSLTPVMKEV